MALASSAGAFALSAEGESPKPATVKPDTQAQYILLLYERAERPAETAAEEKAVVAEYKAWAGELARQGKVVGGEKLADSGSMVQKAGVVRTNFGSKDAGQRLAGYFLLRAASHEEALEIAKTCPHVTRGGRVELRPIEHV